MVIILMGKSASGKDTLQKQIAEDYDIERVVTATTRAMREGEQDGKDYHFMTDQQFNDLKAAGGFVETAEFNGVQYGCPKFSIDFDKEQCIILEPEGVQNFIKELGQENVFVVYLDLDDATRKFRAEGRGSFSEDKWNKRLQSDNERFNENVIESLTNMCVDLDTAMWNGQSPSHIANEIMKGLEVYKDDVKEHPDEKRKIYWDDDKCEYTAGTAEDLKAIKDQYDIPPF